MIALLLIFFGLPGIGLAIDEPDYAVADPELRAISVDSSATESFLSVRADSMGRVFVGGREALFVYEPNDAGGYRPRQELYRFPNHSWVYDIELRGNDVYVLTISALYVIPDAVTKREGLKPKRLIWGVPMGHVHQCLHGLAWGPEGDLYFSMGDPVWYYGDFSRPDHWGHWAFFSRPPSNPSPLAPLPQWVRTPYTGVGGVFRCRPDGSNLQIVARGTRNSCGLAFDDEWNLFTSDNDHESMPADYVPGRLLHVTPHADFSWPRGWMSEKQPSRADLLETMFDGMGRAVPVGMAYYNDAFLPDQYRNSLLIARWCTRAVTRYPLEQSGASFKTKEFPLLVGRNHARPVGVCVGRGGRIFVTIAYMAHNDNSPVYKSDLVMITRADDPATHPFQAIDLPHADSKQLWNELSPSLKSWSRARAAFVELRRREATGTEATRLITSNRRDGPSTKDLVWLAAAAGEKDAAKKLIELARNRNDRFCVQALRALGAFPELNAPPEIFTRLLSDRSPQVQLAAVLGLFGQGTKLAPQIVGGPARSEDRRIRQAATLLLAEEAPVELLAQQCTFPDAPARLAGTLAVGFRLTLPPATGEISDDLPLAPLRSEEAYVIHYADETVDLRHFGRIGNFTVAEHWKNGKHTEEQERLFDLLVARLADSDEQIRLQAAHFLYLLNDPRSEPLVAKARTDSEDRRLAVAGPKGIASVWLVGPFADGDAGFGKTHAPEQGPVDLATEYESGTGTLAWKKTTPDRHYDFEQIFGSADQSSFYAFLRLESASRQRAQLLVGSDDGVKVWHNGRKVWENDISRGALPFQDTLPLDLQPGSNDLLIRVRNITGSSGLYLHYRAVGNVVASLPDQIATASLAERLKDAGPGGNQPAIGPEFFTTDWPKAARQGDTVNGRKLFESLGCAKCHGVAPDSAGVGGPSLAEANKRFTVPYLVESILLPSKQVSLVFRGTIIATKDGQVLTGLIVAETAEKIELLLPDATRRAVAKSDVAEQKPSDLSPMPSGIIKTPGELRDLLAFLLSEKQ